MFFYVLQTVFALVLIKNLLKIVLSIVAENYLHQHNVVCKSEIYN